MVCVKKNDESLFNWDGTKRGGGSYDGTKQLSTEGEKKIVTIMFSDIRSFTSICESTDLWYNYPSIKLLF